MPPKISDTTRAERQEAILQATLACLARDGAGGTSMQTIAAAAGLTKGGLYAYFDSREAILLELAQRYMDEQLSAFAPRAGERATAQLARVFAAYAQGPATSQEATVRESMRRAMFDLWTLAGEIPSVRAALLERHRRYRATLAGIIQRGQAEGDFRATADALQVTDLILATRDGVSYHAVHLGLPVAPATVTDLLWAALQPYLSPER